jgi:hypothetical protein
MRKLSLLLTLLGVLLTPALNAQYSLFKTMSYQGVARNASGTPVANQAISVRFQLQYGLSDAYIETQSLTTNAFGVFSAQIGDGTPVGGAFPSYDAIDWWGGYAAGLQVWIDITGGTNYVQAGGTSLRSVPFAALSEQSFALLDSSLYSSPTRVFMKPTARMGLGTETPQSLVDVEGGMAIGATYSGTTAAPANGLIVEGNVGFGTTAPGSLLQVGSYLTASDNYITVASEGGNLWRSGLRLRHYNSQNGYTIESDERGATLGLNVLDHAESLTGTSCLFIQKGSGNVGLSTTTPVNKIDVEGGAAIGATYSGTTAAPTNGLIVEGNTGIGTNDPQAKLHVAGTTRLVDGTQGAGKVLTSDASGNAAWSTVVSSGSYTPTLSEQWFHFRGWDGLRIQPGGFAGDRCLRYHRQWAQFRCGYEHR